MFDFFIRIFRDLVTYYVVHKEKELFSYNNSPTNLIVILQLNYKSPIELVGLIVFF